MACISNSTKAIVITAEVLGFVVLLATLYVIYRIFVVRYVKDRERDAEPDEEKAIRSPAPPASATVYKPLPSQPPVLPPFRPQRPPEHLLPSQQGRALRQQSYRSNSLSPDLAETRPMIPHTALDRRI